MKKAKAMFIGLAAVLFTYIASMVATSACWYGWYQPVEPKSLRNK